VIVPERLLVELLDSRTSAVALELSWRPERHLLPNRARRVKILRAQSHWYLFLFIGD
jgi:hypothetical protein